MGFHTLKVIGIGALVFSQSCFATDSTGSPSNLNYLPNLSKNLSIPSPFRVTANSIMAGGEAGSSGQGCSSCRACFNPWDGYHATNTAPYLASSSQYGDYYTVLTSGYYAVSATFTWSVGQMGPFDPPLSIWVDLYATTVGNPVSNSDDSRLFYTGDLGYQMISNSSNNTSVFLIWAGYFRLRMRGFICRGCGLMRLRIQPIVFVLIIQWIFR